MKKINDMPLYTLVSISDANIIQEMVVQFQNELSPSLEQRNINLIEYAHKLYKYGKVWCQCAQGIPISIIAGYFNDKNSYKAYLSLLVVDKNYRKRNLATLLLLNFEKYAYDHNMRMIELEVRKNNYAAQFLYNKCGYIEFSEASKNSFYMRKILAQKENIGKGGKKKSDKKERNHEFAAFFFI